MRQLTKAGCKKVSARQRAGPRLTAPSCGTSTAPPAPEGSNRLLGERYAPFMRESSPPLPKGNVTCKTLRYKIAALREAHLLYQVA